MLERSKAHFMNAIELSQIIENVDDDTQNSVDKWSEKSLSNLQPTPLNNQNVKEAPYEIRP